MNCSRRSPNMQLRASYAILAAKNLPYIGLHDIIRIDVRIAQNSRNVLISVVYRANIAGQSSRIFHQSDATRVQNHARNEAQSLSAGLVIPRKTALKVRLYLRIKFRKTITSYQSGLLSQQWRLFESHRSDKRQIKSTNLKGGKAHAMEL